MRQRLSVEASVLPSGNLAQHPSLLSFWRNLLYKSGGCVQSRRSADRVSSSAQVKAAWLQHDAVNAPAV